MEGVAVTWPGAGRRERRWIVSAAVRFATQGDDVIATIDGEAYRTGPQFRIESEDNDYNVAILCTPQMACDLAVGALAFAKRYGVTP